MNRRRLLSTISLTLFAGCTGETKRRDERNESSTPNRPNSTAVAATTGGETGTSRGGESKTPPQSAADALPSDNDTWKRTNTEGFPYSVYGGEDGVKGVYENGSGERHHVIVMIMKEEYSPTRDAHSFACAGWPIALSERNTGLMIAAGTGTDPAKTFTPEAPPTLSRTPIPNSTSRTEDLLLTSPYVDEGFLSENSVSC